jgi:hypothetical protein
MPKQSKPEKAVGKTNMNPSDVAAKLAAGTSQYTVRGQ